MQARHRLIRSVSIVLLYVTCTVPAVLAQQPQSRPGQSEDVVRVNTDLVQTESARFTANSLASLERLVRSTVSCKHARNTQQTGIEVAST